jgi:HD-like signal output (HDOD) protein
VKTRSELTAREADALQDSIIQRLGDTSVPTLPEVALKIVELISDPDSTIKQFSRIIANDQALTGRMLRMCNSAAFAQRQPVTTVERATVLLGLERIKALALGFHLSKSAAEADNGEPDFKLLWTRSLMRAWIALRLAEPVDKSVAGEAFIIALLSDAGLPSMPRLVDRAQWRAITEAGTTPAKQMVCETRTLPLTHVDVAQALCRMWKLPDRLAKPIAWHHACPSAMTPADPLSVLHAASFVAGSIPLGPADAIGDTTTIRGHARELFNLDEPALAETIRQAGVEFDRCKSIFSDIIDDNASVESMIDHAMEQFENPPAQTPDAPTEQVSAGGMRYTLRAEPDRRITATIADEDGNELLTERFDPRELRVADLRKLLMLEQAEPQEFTAVRQKVVGLAA